MKMIELIVFIIHPSWIIRSVFMPAARRPEKEKAGSPFLFRQPGCLDQTRGFPSLPRGRSGFILCEGATTLSYISIYRLRGGSQTGIF